MDGTRCVCGKNTGEQTRLACFLPFICPKAAKRSEVKWSNMLGFLKSFLGRRGGAPNGDHLDLAPDTAQAPAETPTPLSAIGPLPGPAPGRLSPEAGIELALDAILKELAPELRPKLRSADTTDMTVMVPLDRVLSQLSRGAVRITFGELRRAAPQAFVPGPERDQVLVTLPLAEVLAKLNPALIKRRRVQKQVEVPPEIVSPFDPERRRLNGSIGLRAEAGPLPAPVPPGLAVSQPRPTAELPPSPLDFDRRSLAPRPRLSEPVSSPSPADHRTPALRSVPDSSPTPPPAQTASPQWSPGAGASPTPPSAASPSIPAERVRTDPAPEPFTMTLAPLAQSWPDAIRAQIAQLGSFDARLSMPADLVEGALRQGRILFSWRALRGWITPQLPPSALDETMLELPLRVVAPLFLARRKVAGQPQKPIPDQTIPNLFFGSPRPSPAPGHDGTALAEEKRAETQLHGHNGSGKALTSQEAPPAHRHATPNEVVSRAAGLEGVAGALLALPDGLLVASQLQEDVNAEALAAFVPQIFSKVAQCTKELHLGDLLEMSFVVGNTPWRIFRVNSIFFAAFGRGGVSLPGGELRALAEELNHKPK